MDPASPAHGADRNPVRVYRVCKNGILTVTFLGAYRGLYHHRDRKRTPPCLGDLCPRATHCLPRIFYAYSPVEIWDTPTGKWVRSVLQITSNMEETLRGLDLRGQVWCFRRSVPGDKNSAVCAEFVSNVDVATLPPEFALTPVLERFFCTAGIELGASNETPTRLAFPPSLRPGPQIKTDYTERKETEPTEDQKKRLREVLASASKIPPPNTSRNGVKP